jgi:phosphoribosylanthranilate isomerase
MLVKYCGCQTEEDFRMLSSTAADVIGFIFADSRRKVDPEVVKKWLSGTKSEKKLAGVFQNATLEEMVEIADNIPLDIIQCHGDESPQTLIQLKKKTNKEIYKALPCNEEILNVIPRYAGAADALIIDSVSKGQFGGTGKKFEWGRIPEILNAARKCHVLCFIAGGITSSNVKALLAFEPDGIDISGGIERDGKKCLKKITELEGMYMYDNRNRT